MTFEPEQAVGSLDRATARRIPPLLRMAVLGGIEPTVRRHLVNAGCPDLADGEGRTLLWLAAAKGQHHICKLLIEAGADPLRADTHGLSIEAAALESGSASTIQLIRSAAQGARIESDAVDRTGNDPGKRNGLAPATQDSGSPDDASDRITVFTPDPSKDPEQPVAGLASDNGKEFPVAGAEEADPFDLLGDSGYQLEWSAEKDAPRPIGDESCLPASVSLHDRISRFRVTEKDTDWSDIEILFPEIRRGRISYQGIEDEFLRCVVGVVQEGLETGSVPLSWIEAAAGNAPGGMDEDEALLRMEMLLGDLGIQTEDWTLDPRSGATPDGDPEEVSEEVLSYLSTLFHPDQDELSGYYRSLGFLKLLSPEEEQHFGRLWTESGDSSGLDALVIGNLRYVIREARKFPRNTLGLDDLVNEGNLGLIEGAKRFDPTRENRFLTYASWWVRQSIFRALADHGNGIRIPQKVAGTLLQYRRLVARLERELGHVPTEDEVLNSGVYTRSEIAQLIRLEHSTTLVSLNEHDCLQGTFRAGSQYSSTDPTPDQLLAIEDDESLLWEALSHLSEKERTIISLHFGLEGREEETLESIGRLFSPPISRERVRQLEERAFSRMVSRFPHLREQLRTIRQSYLIPNPRLYLQEDDDECE